MSAALIAALAAVRRILTTGPMLLAVAGGVVAGGAMLGLAEPSLVRDVFPVLVQVLAALLLLPLAAALPSSERAGGFEQLVAVRPVGSLAWTLGRLAGGMLGAATLALLLAVTARAVGARALVPVEVDGAYAGETRGAPTFTFAVPPGARGPFDLTLQTLPLDPAGALLRASVQRGGQRRDLPPIVVQRRTAVLAVPDLSPERGDLSVSLNTDANLLQRDVPPRLTVGTRPLGRGALPLPWESAGPLLLATLAALAAGCAFHFETACLAGLLGIAVRMPAAAWVWVAACAGLVALAVLGTALQRRAALP